MVRSAYKCENNKPKYNTSNKNLIFIITILKNHIKIMINNRFRSKKHFQLAPIHRNQSVIWLYLG